MSLVSSFFIANLPQFSSQMINEWIGFILCEKVTTFKKNNSILKLKTSKSTCLHSFISHFIPVFLFGQPFMFYPLGFIV